MTFIVAGGIVGITVGAIVGASLGYKLGTIGGWHFVARMHQRTLTPLP